MKQQLLPRSAGVGLTHMICRSCCIYAYGPPMLHCSCCFVRTVMAPTTALPTFHHSQISCPTPHCCQSCCPVNWWTRIKLRDGSGAAWSKVNQKWHRSTKILWRQHRQSSWIKSRKTACELCGSFCVLQTTSETTAADKLGMFWRLVLLHKSHVLCESCLI